MKATTLHEIIKTFLEHNEKHGYHYGVDYKGETITAVIVYKQSNFSREYGEESRSYRVDNFSGKRFFYGMSGNSIYGDCLDGSEYGVRLDAYSWEIEKCYFESGVSE